MTPRKEIFSIFAPGPNQMRQNDPTPMKIRLFTIPNCVTLCNLLCGSAAVVASLVHGNLTGAFLFVLLAAVFDFLDGFAARLLDAYSLLGVQLDSLADMVSFGLAPAAILFTLYGQAAPACEGFAAVAPQAGYLLFLMTAFSALRLAKFNVDDTQHVEFCGLTTTANALFCASTGWLAATGSLALSCEAILATAAVVSWLLISPIRMFSFKFDHFGWRGNELRYGFIAAAAGLLIALRGAAIPLVIILYVAVSTVRWIACRKRPGADA